MWLGQTGGICVFENAGLDELNNWTGRLLTASPKDDTGPLSETQYALLRGLEKFRREMTKFQEDRFEMNFEPGGAIRSARDQPYVARHGPASRRKSYMLCSPEGAHIPDTYVSPFTGKKK